MKAPNRCVDCSKFKEQSGMGFCKKNRWEIALDLARRVAVCSDEPVEEIEMVTVLTPCGHKALISREAYEKEKDRENFWKPICT